MTERRIVKKENGHPAYPIRQIALGFYYGFILQCPRLAENILRSVIPNLKLAV